MKQSQQDLVLLIEHPNLEPLDLKRILDHLQDFSTSDAQGNIIYHINNDRSIFCFQNHADSDYFASLLDVKFKYTFYPLGSYPALVEKR